MGNRVETRLADTGDHVSFRDLVARFYESEPVARVDVDVAGKSHPGNVRPNNEDQYAVIKRYRGRTILGSSVPTELLPAEDDSAYTIIVADGLGGHHFGELASLLAIRAGWELGRNEIKWVMKVNDREIEELRQKADVFCQLVNEALLIEARHNPRLEGMATTLTMCYSVGPELFTVHVGDSRAYLWRDGRIERLTHDHNLGQVLVDSGIEEPDSPRVKRVKHVLTNCLGSAHSLPVAEVQHHRLQDGDRVLVCSDGLSNMVDDQAIAQVMTEHPESSDACRALVDLALERGGKDNVTVVVARFSIVEPPARAPEDDPSATR